MKSCRPGAAPSSIFMGLAKSVFATLLTRRNFRESQASWVRQISSVGDFVLAFKIYARPRPSVVCRPAGRKEKEKEIRHRFYALMEDVLQRIKTKAFTSTAAPSGGGVIRNMAAAGDGRLYLTCSGVNKVAVAEIKSTECC